MLFETQVQILRNHEGPLPDLKTALLLIHGVSESRTLRVDFLSIWYKHWSAGFFTDIRYIDSTSTPVRVTYAIRIENEAVDYLEQAGLLNAHQLKTRPLRLIDRAA